MPPPLTRRQILCAAAAAAIAIPPDSHAALWDNNNTNLYDLLDTFHFLGQDGKPFGRKALVESLKGKSVIMSFFYKGCGATDPQILTQQAKIANAVKPEKLVHLVIDTNPFSDFANAAPGIGDMPRDAFLKDITEPNANPAFRYPEGTQYLPKENTIVLYPLNGQGKPFGTQQEAQHVIKQIQKAAGGLVIESESVDNDGPGHFSRLTLYGPDGASVLAGRAESIDPSAWIAKIHSAQQGRGR